MKSPVLLLAALINDILAQSIHTKGLKRDYLTLVARFENEGVSFLSYTLPILDEALLKGLEEGKFACPTNFSKIRKGALPKLFSGLLGNIFDPYTGLLLDQPCVECISNLHTILRLFKKLSLAPKNQQKLVLRAQLKYSQLENRICEYRSLRSPRKLDLLKRVASIVFAGLSFDPTSIMGKHGPGAVNEKMSPNDKWRYLSTSINLDDRLDQMSYTEAYNPHVCDIDPLVDARGYMSEVISVPKNSSSVRLITVEPFLNQFIQGGLKKFLWDFISQSPLKQCLQLDRQELNQKLALDGSLTKEWSTLDLSSASDLVDNELVNEIFCNHQEFLKFLMKSRTPMAKFGSSKFLHEKFAGMGNATTFPIQSIIYALLCICSILDYEGKQPSYRNVVRIASRSIQIYGDDIIVKSRYYSSVDEWLTSFGFILNDSKSFSKGNFRESCGIDAYMGVDITPIYVRFWPLRTGLDQKTLCNLISCSNSLWNHCYYRAATFIKEIVEEDKGILPSVRSDSSCLGWVDRWNSYSYSKWDKNLHRFLVYAHIVKSKTRSDVLSGYPALLKFFHMPYDSVRHESLDEIRSKDHLKRSSVRYNSYIKRQWCTV